MVVAGGWKLEEHEAGASVKSIVKCRTGFFKSAYVI